MEINFSIDDLNGAFCWLQKNNARSIYESFVFKTLRDIHTKYNIKIDAYCIVDVNKKSICDVSDKWLDEFKNTEDWLRFGFHSFDAASNYDHAIGEEIKKEYRVFEKEIKRITGHKNCSDMVRLHYFSGNSDVMKSLKSCGIQTFLTADDDRVSYGLNRDAVNHLNSRGEWEDTNTNIKYIKTDFRIERVLDKTDEEIIGSLTNKNRVTFFTHESLLNNIDICLKIYHFMDSLKAIG